MKPLQHLRRACFFGAAALVVPTLLGSVLSCGNVGYPRPPAITLNEKFDPSLAKIRSVSAAESHIRAGLPPGATPAQVAAAVEEFASQRFMRGYSSYSLCDNWFAYVAGGAWFNLRVPIDADAVLRHDVAFCTQNATVVQALLERFGIQHASAKFGRDKHIASVALIENRWAYYDGDLEPSRSGVIFLDGLPGMTPDIFARWKGTFFYDATIRGDIRVTPPTKALSSAGRAFELVSWLISWFGWAFLLCVGFGLRQLERKLAPVHSTATQLQGSDVAGVSAEAFRRHFTATEEKGA